MPIPNRTGEELVNEIEAIVLEALDYGLEVAAVAHGVIIFRRIPRGGPTHVTSTLVDRNGYPR